MSPRAATASSSRSGTMSSSSRTTAPYAEIGSRGGRASASTLSNAQVESLIGPKPNQRSHVPPSPQPSRTPNRPPHSSSQHRQQSATTTTTSIDPTDNDSNHSSTNLDISRESRNARKDLLRESVFPNWKNDATNSALTNPEELQKQDPLATQIWKLYSKTKTQLPNQERMENLTWRMMAMNLKRKEREQARYEMQHHVFATLCEAL